MNRIVYYGPFYDASGYAVASRGYLKAFNRLIENGENIELKTFSLPLENLNAKLTSEEKSLNSKYSFKSKEEILEWVNSDEPFMFIWHQPAPMLMRERYEYDSKWSPTYEIVRLMLDNCAWNVNFTVWEGDRVHSGWVDIYNIYNIDAVVVPSKYNFKTFNRDYAGKVFQIPHPIENKKIKSVPMNLPVSLEDKLVFFSMSQWGFRKGFDKLITSYLMTFGHAKDVVLIIKTDGGLQNGTSINNSKERVFNEANQIKSSVVLENPYEKPTAEIVLIADFLPQENVEWLWEQCDVYISAARSEGFGLTIAEALSKGKPVISTQSTGHEEFFNENVLKVNSFEQPYWGRPEFTSDMNYMEPDIKSLGQRMKFCQEETNYSEGSFNMKKNFNSLKEIGRTQKEYFDSKDYSVERIGQELLKMLEKVTQK